MTRPSEPSDILVIPRHLCHDAMASPTLGELLRLYEVADNTWPSPAPIPRWTTPELLEELTQAGRVVLVDGDRYTVPAVEENRQRQLDWHRAGGKARASQAPRDRGRFASSDQQRPAATSS